jgi:hypothetical protein
MGLGKYMAGLRDARRTMNEDNGKNGETWGEESTIFYFFIVVVVGRVDRVRVVVLGRVDFGYMPAYMHACMK